MKAPPSKASGKPQTQRRAFAAPSARKPVIGGKPENPFDKFANAKKKHEVLNRRVKGEDRNMGRAREKAIDERKTKLLRDYQSNKKSNTILDKRFGESDPTMSLEERMFMRFQKEKVKHVRNSSAFNLEAADTEILTHKGQVLGNSNLEDNDWVSSDDEEKTGGLGKQVVDSLHFGGGLQRRQNSAPEELPGKGRLDALQEIVMKSKLQKMQKKEAKEEQEEERTKLDKAYQDLFSSSLLDFNGGKADRKTSRRDDNGLGNTSKEDLDEYDLALKEMTYEAKLPASERTKSAEEIALAEQKRIEELEEARIKRMKQASSTDKRAKDDVEPEDNGKASKRKHRTDDEIEDDSFGVVNKAKKAMGRDRAAERAAQKEETTSAAYNEYIMQDEEYEDSSEGEGEVDGSDEEGEEGDSDEEEGDEEQDEDDEEGDEGEESEGEHGSGSEGDEEEDDEEGSDMGSDMEGDEGEDADSEEEEKPAVLAKKGVAFAKDTKADKPVEKAAPVAKVSGGKKGFVQAVDEVNMEMPHKIDCPPDMETFDELIDQYVLNPLLDMSALIDRIIAWNNVHLPGAEGAENRNLMHNFLDILLKHFLRVGDSLATVPADAQANTMQQLDYLSGVIFKLSTDVGEAPCAALWGRTIKILHSQLQKRLRDYAQGEREVSCWPSLGRLLLMQLIGRVFSVTDLKNDVVGPAALLLCQALSQCPVSTPADIAAGLLTCSVLLTYNAETKRYVPEVVAFIHTVLSMYLPSVGESSSVRLPQYFQGTFNLTTLANLRELLSSADKKSDYKMRWSYFSSKKVTENSSAAAGAVLSFAYSTLGAAVDLYSASAALPEILSPVIETLRSLRPQSKPFAMPVALQQQHLQVLERVMQLTATAHKTRQPLQWRKSVTSSIEMKNPRFQLDYTFKKDIDPDQDRAKVKQLTRQLKREEKAAMRELRRDSDFIDQERYREQQEAKEHRRAERVKNFGFMEEQQATINLQVRKGGGLMTGGGSGVVKKARVKRL